ncbi:MAG: alpha/beta fold hydrolase [Solirubrobacteraceae bacterium]|nr:alpha/beta fold hydrolase [Patulibacter sp.]
MFLKSKRAAIAAAVCAIAGGAAAAPAAQAAEPAPVYGPQQLAFLGAFSYSIAHYSPNLVPPGTNNWSCRPTAANPTPVVLVHGTWENAYDNWAYIAPRLQASGECVYALNYSTKNAPFNGTGSIKASAGELATFVDKVLAQTGASKVDIVGHSQGAMMPRAYIKYYGGASKVKNLVALNGTQSGTTLDGIGTLGNELKVMSGVAGVIGDAARDQVVGSPFLTDLNAGGMTVSSVRYTAIATKYDEVTTPYTNAFITDNRSGAYVKNITLQDGCGTNFAEHLSEPYSARTLYFVKQALGLSVPPTPTCDIQLPIF